MSGEAFRLGASFAHSKPQPANENQIRQEENYHEEHKSKHASN